MITFEKLEKEGFESPMNGGISSILEIAKNYLISGVKEIRIYPEKEIKDKTNSELGRHYLFIRK